MEVILLEHVDKLGKMGEKVNVKKRLCPQLPAAVQKSFARN